MKIGSLSCARKLGRLGVPGSIVTLGPSNLPDAGQGLFTLVDLPAGAFVTEYEGVVLREDDPSLSPKDKDYLLQLPPHHAPDESATWTIVGKWYDLEGCGIGQMANDAIHLEISGRNNNCRFRFHKGRAYLQTLQPVSAGEELLVSYHISYWLNRQVHHPNIKSWLHCIRKIAKLLAKKGFELEDYESIEQITPNRGIARFAASAGAHAQPPKGCMGHHDRKLRWFDLNLILGHDERTYVTWKCHHCNTWIQRLGVIA